MSLFKKHILKAAHHNSVYQHKIQRADSAKNTIEKRHEPDTKIIKSNHEKAVEIPKGGFIVINSQWITILYVVFGHIDIIIAQKRTYKFGFIDRRKYANKCHQKKDSK